MSCCYLWRAALDEKNHKKDNDIFDQTSRIVAEFPIVIFPIVLFILFPKGDVQDDNVISHRLATVPALLFPTPVLPTGHGAPWQLRRWF